MNALRYNIFSIGAGRCKRSHEVASHSGAINYDEQAYYRIDCIGHNISLLLTYAYKSIYLYNALMSYSN